MPGYGQFCPVAQALEVLGERWTLLIVREVLCGSRRFGEIQRGVPLVSRSVLSQRLKALSDAGVVEHRDGEYHPTEACEDLRPIVVACGVWGQKWAHRQLKSSDVDIALLMWDMRRRIDHTALPNEPVFVEFEFRGAPAGKGRYWLHLDGGDADLCLTNPGREVSLHVSSTPKVMAEVWLGELPLERAIRTGDVRVEGPRKLARAFPSWLLLSVFAERAQAA